MIESYLGVMQVPSFPSKKKSASKPPKGAGSGIEGSEAGSSCHQCKNRRPFNFLSFCSNSAKNTDPNNKKVSKICRKKYCDLCLDKFYREIADSSRSNAS